MHVLSAVEQIMLSLSRALDNLYTCSRIFCVSILSVWNFFILFNLCCSQHWAGITVINSFWETPPDNLEAWQGGVYWQYFCQRVTWPCLLLWLDNPITGRWRLVSVNVYSFSWRKPCACMLHWKSQTNYKTVICANWQSLHLILILTSCPAVLGRVVIEKKFLDFVAIF